MQVVVGAWIPLWDIIRKPTPDSESTGKTGMALYPAALLGSAMVARGEIGLLIIQIGYNDTPYVSAAGFYTGVWAILLNTIIGPVVVGLLIKHKAQEIGAGRWGTVENETKALTSSQSIQTELEKSMEEAESSGNPIALS